jgi:hypothetical protein
MMDLANLIPIVAIVSTFGCPVAILYVWKFFKLREKELQLDVELRREQGTAIEARLARLEQILLQLAPPQHASLMEPPATTQDELAGPSLPVTPRDRNS